ncbi:MAG: IS21 family transposase, partial [Bacillus sp. (in: Bacteria)]|nr:IS21 family transposase [Bacillus sp. (in: firmicutes)]
YEYIKYEVDVRITRKIIEIFYKNFRIASHMRLEGKDGQLSTIPEHMPVQHKQYLDFNRDYFMKWAEAVGPNSLAMVKALLNSYKLEKQALKSCMGLNKLAVQYSIERLGSACKRAFSYSPRPNLNSIKTILKSGQDKLNSSATLTTGFDIVDQGTTHGFVRGAAYYGRKDK